MYFIKFNQKFFASISEIKVNIIICKEKNYLKF